MFTVAQIKEAHSKVKSGADFPQFVQDLITLGVTYYETFVADGHTDYFGKNDYKTSSPPRYAELTIAEETDAIEFKKQLKEHQQGVTDYLTFCDSCAKLGVEKWEVCMEKMTCTYRDKAGNELLVEVIPVPKRD